MLNKLKTYYVYSLANPITGEVFYVGCTSNIQRRYLSHLVYNPKKDTRRRLTLRITDKDAYIIKNKIVPVMDVLDQVTGTQEEGFLLEAIWIRSFARKYNSLTNKDHNFRSLRPKYKAKKEIVKVIYK